MTHDSDVLYFGFSTEPPTLGDDAVRTRIQRQLLGVPFRFEVLDASLHVYSTALGFHQVTSRRPIEGDDVDVYQFDPAAGIDHEFAFSAGPVQIRTAVWTTAPAMSGADFDHDIHHDRDDGSVVAVGVGERSYETYHSVPDRDRTLRSRTVLPES
jgi:hypothetical protein